MWKMKNPVKNPFLIILIFIFLLGTANAQEITQSEYYFVIQDNGNTIAGINLYGSGEISLPIQSDVEQVYVEGGLYMKENETITIAIGTTESATLIYQTSLLTSKTDDKWTFYAEMENQTEKTIMIALPSNVIIQEIDENAMIETGDFTKIYFNNTNPINFSYSFPSNAVIPSENSNSSSNPELNHSGISHHYSGSDSDTRNITFDLAEVLINISEGSKPIRIASSETVSYRIPIIACIVIGSVGVLLFVSLYFIKSARKRTISPRQVQILQTLTENESKIVKLLLENKEILRRSFIEKKLELAKSSLAATLNNLERKKIVEIDKTLTTHRIKLTDWFLKI